MKKFTVKKLKVVESFFSSHVIQRRDELAFLTSAETRLKNMIAHTLNIAHLCMIQSLLTYNSYWFPTSHQFG